MSRAPRSAAARRSWGEDDSGVDILHVDMDAFFVSVELLDRPELRGRAVAVGGQERGVVSAASYEAREFGVNSAMPVGLAKRRCPHLVMIPPRYGRYSEVSRRIMSILRDVTPLVEQLSVDEAFLDVSGARLLMGGPVEIARRLRSRIRAQEGVAASVGIAKTKHVAKIASAHAVGALWGGGERTRERLEARGITTVGELADMGRTRLTRILGRAMGTHLYELAMGVDPRPVTVSREEKSVGREETFFVHVAERSELERVLLAQAHDTARRLRKRRLAARAVSIKVRFADFTTISRSATLAQPTDLAWDLYSSAKRLLGEVRIGDAGLRLLGLRAEQLVDPRLGVQLALDADPRRDRAEAALDEVVAKFGARMAGPASLVGRGTGRLPADAPPGDHGGLSRSSPTGYS